MRRPVFDPDELSSNPVAFVAMLGLIFWSGLVVLICASRIATVFFSAEDFVVSSSHQVCEQPLNNRCETHYSIVRAGGKVVDFVPFGYQFNHGLLVEGTHIAKSAESFAYVIDGRTEQWPYLGSHFLALFGGITGVLAWLFFIRMGILPLWFRTKSE
ncbi:hypothetical protein ACXU4B_10940 [Dyella soli]|uniref:Uncharacterized protein n=1 Tax=Dyella soli TaxID=522319 RepID=A0A4R0YJB2_9GAMM|nr:hypothetical protein [Dyella soli]TCI07312.1 hypothetical protein EZM97_32480 [Dyella soli]